jgi:hypothetical protein
MSLTHFLTLKDVKDRFRSDCCIPRLPEGRELLAPPQTSHTILPGTAFDYLLRWEIKRRNRCHAPVRALERAFDYLLRWGIKRRNPDMIERRWVAEHAPHLLRTWMRQPPDELASDQQRLQEWYAQERARGEEQAKTAEKIIARAKAAEKAYVETGEVTGELLRSALFLAELDRVYREGIVPPDLGTVYDDDIEDLRQLLAIVPPDLFRASRLCVLNPTFRKASSMIYGADADLLVDETLIEIKTTKFWKIRPEYIFQLAGYYLLSRVGGIDGAPAGHEIARVGIYFSRFGYLFTAGVEEIIRPETFPAFEKWFRRQLRAYEKDMKRRMIMLP